MYVVFEGVDGVGKSTQIGLLKEFFESLNLDESADLNALNSNENLNLKGGENTENSKNSKTAPVSKDYKNLKALVKKGVIFTQEPGGTDFGKHLRELLLEKNLNFSKKAEFLLFLADRAELAEQILKPNANKLIISDRSFISGLAYSNLDFESAFKLNCFALSDFLPQKVVFLKAKKELLEQRFSKKSLDRIEKRGLEYFLSVQEKIEKALHALKTRTNLDFLILDAAQDRENLHYKIKEFIND